LDAATPLEISVLKREFQIAVQRGLQIAVFNCCSGLGLADQLIDVNIPYIIVMRVEIPNDLAKQFLKNLLIQYRQGADFPQSFKFARHQLSLTAPSKFANWLPVLFHNPLSKSVTWQDLVRSRAKLPLPIPVVNFCRSISHQQARVWTGLGLGLALAVLGCILKYQPAVQQLENNLVDRFQQIQAARTTRTESAVVWVHYDALTVMGLVTDAELLLDAINQVSQNATVIAWGIGLSLEPSKMAVLERPNVITDCPASVADKTAAGYVLQQPNCHNSSLASELLIKYQGYQQLPATVPVGELRWNAGTQRFKSMNISEISALSNAQIHSMFHGKVVVVSTAMADALALERLLLATASDHNLPLLQPVEPATEFFWILLWSTATTMIVGQIGRRLLFIPIVTTILSSYLIVGGLLLANGYMISTLVMVLAIGSAGLVTFCIRDIGGRLYPDLGAIYYRRGLAKLRAGERQAAIDDLIAAAQLCGERGQKNQELQIQQRIKQLGG
jgi:hypothetical protein